ncbi:MAG: GNAT family N-acetyltransferase [Gemmatimonadota bacterium]
MEILEISDEREPLADAALELIGQAFSRPDRQPLSELRSEVAEKRMGLLAAMDFHLMAAVTSDGEVVGTAAGIYLEGVNAGFVTYLAVSPHFQGRRLGPSLRSALVRCLRRDARAAGHPDLAWALGEIEADSDWLTRLLQRRAAITFDLTYFHPGMNPESTTSAFILYRQPVGDEREVLPADEVRRILYSIYRRGYRVRYPLVHSGFQDMLLQLQDREWVGEHPGFPRRPPPLVE